MFNLVVIVDWLFGMSKFKTEMSLMATLNRYANSNKLVFPVIVQTYVK